MRHYIVVFHLLFVCACSSSPVPRGVLLPERMKTIVFDLIRTDEFLNSFISKNSTVDIRKKRSILYNQVFKVNNTSKDEFFSSYKYYQQHPDIQKNLFDSLYQDLNNKKIDKDTAKVVKPIL